MTMSIATAACRPCVPACPPAIPVRAGTPASSTSSSTSSRRCVPWRSPAAACGRSRAAWARQSLRVRAAAEDAAEDLEEQEEEPELDVDELPQWIKDFPPRMWEQLWRQHLQEREEEIAKYGPEGKPQVLYESLQHGMRGWQPSGSREAEDQQRQQQRGAVPAAAAAAAAVEEARAEAAAAAAAAAEGAEAAAPAPTYEELLAQLPGLQRQLREAAQERSGLVLAPTPDAWDSGEMFRYPRKPEPQLSEWDMRAKMEKRRRQQREIDAWNERRAQAGLFPTLGADWRTDVRCQHTGDPTDPVYREWTHKEIWDLITLNGRNADPRNVELFVRNPLEIADAPAQGSEYRMDPEEYFESIGALIREDELAAIARSASGRGDGELDGAEAALLASEFSDFDDELGDFDADYGAGGADTGDDDDF